MSCINHIKIKIFINSIINNHKINNMINIKIQHCNNLESNKNKKNIKIIMNHIYLDQINTDKKYMKKNHLEKMAIIFIILWIKNIV